VAGLGADDHDFVVEEVEETLEVEGSEAVAARDCHVGVLEV